MEKLKKININWMQAALHFG